MTNQSNQSADAVNQGGKEVVAMVLSNLNSINQGWDLPEDAQKLLDQAIAALSSIKDQQAQPVEYNSLTEIPTKELAARVVSSLIECEGNLNRYQLVIEALIGGLHVVETAQEQGRDDE